MKKLAIFVLLFVAGMAGAMAQADMRHINLDATTNGTTIQGPAAGLRLYDDGGPNGNSGHGYDYSCVIESTCDSSEDATTFLSITVMSYDIAPYDTLYIYDGPTTSDPLITKFNSSLPLSSMTFYISRANTTRKLCIRYRAGVKPNNDTAEYFGFVLDITCKKPCESVVAVIDTIYDRLDKYGNVIGTSSLKPVPTSFDTIFGQEWVTDSTGQGRWVDNRDSIVRIDTLGWDDGALLCIGQNIRFHGHGEYSSHYGYYTASDSSSLFHWTFGTGDSLKGNNLTLAPYHGYSKVGCFDVILKITDESGCTSKNYMKIQVRLAQNPIKTIFDLSPICNNDSLMVNVGYEGDNGTLTLKKIKFATVVSKVNEVRTFIPDGPRCADPCYKAPVLFNEFPSGRAIQSADDICSICVNFEHSFMGDYSLAILCPTYDDSNPTAGGRAFLKYKDISGLQGYTPPEGTWGGGGRYTGCPAGNPPDNWDNIGATDVCDSVSNPFGVGWNYCFSRNSQYTLVTNEPCNTANPTGAGIASAGYANPQTFQIPIMVPPFNNAGTDAGVHTVTTKDSSDHLGMANYYIPADDFTSLVGCPLNGEWNIQVCDYWQIDNGWVFNWSMDICNLSAGGGCDYQVGIDSVVWHPDTNYVTDFYDGIYRGLIINQQWENSTTAYISSPDTSGDFRIKLSIYDEFGCRWDTLTNIATVATPLPTLGNDTTICDVATIDLDASDKFTNEKYSFTWEPYGETTPTITTTPNTKRDHTYIVEAVHRDKNIQCIARDTIVVRTLPQPIPNFDPGIYPLEGCEPLTINIVNTTKNGYKYRWVFGDGTYSTLKEPTHSYAAGHYDFKYYVESEGGCKDSLIYPGLVTVFPQPDAQFSWEPTFPTVLHPSIALHNTTTPDNGTNIYRWEIQYDKENPYSFHTATEKNPTFTWQTPSSGDISGSYTVRLIARTDNYGPSGKPMVCRDTVENTILIINDQLEFPNVVTPNGDGFNDRFVIKNLVEGLAYPVNQLDIYDKWGSRVFHAANISKEEDFWDPAANNCPAGSYFYRFVAKGYKGNIEHNGVIEVLK